MAKTVSVTSMETVWVTTYYGGYNRGTCFDISVQISDEEQVTATFTVDELVELLREKGSVKGLAKPEFDKGLT